MKLEIGNTIGDKIPACTDYYPLKSCNSYVLVENLRFDRRISFSLFLARRSAYSDHSYSIRMKKQKSIHDITIHMWYIA